MTQEKDFPKVAKEHYPETEIVNFDEEVIISVEEVNSRTVIISKRVVKVLESFHLVFY